MRKATSSSFAMRTMPSLGSSTNTKRRSSSKTYEQLSKHGPHIGRARGGDRWANAPRLYAGEHALHILAAALQILGQRTRLLRLRVPRQFDR